MILVLMLVVSLAGALGLGLLPGVRRAAAVAVAITLSGVVLALACGAAATFDRARAGEAQLGVNVSWIPQLGVRFHIGVDGLSLPLVVLTALLTTLCCIHAIRYVPEPGNPATYLAVLLGLETALLATFMSLDLVLFFAAFESVLLPMYFLIAIWGGPARRAAATKFVLFTLLGSTLMLVAIFALRVHTGSSDMVAMATAHGAGIPTGVQNALFLGFLAAFAIKAPLWPLHSWLPDAHSEAPTAGSVLLAGVLLKMGTYGLLRIAVPVLPHAAHTFAPLLGTLATVAIIYGAFCCLAQTDVKRLIAYSSVGHMGFILLGIASLTPLGISAALFGNVAHGVITSLLFFLAGSLKERDHTYSIADLGSGLLKRAPRLGAVLVFALIATLGLPGLAGFWGEVLAIFASFRPASGLPVVAFRFFMGAALFGTLLAAGYALWLIQRVVTGRPREGEGATEDVSRVEWAAWAPLIGLTLVLGLYPDLVLGVSRAAALAVLGMNQ